jgi:hypothetical protein
MQGELPAGLAVLLRGLARGLQHVGRNARDIGRVLDVVRERVGGVEQVVGKARFERRQLLADLLETGFLVLRQLGPSQTKIAQRVLDDRALSGAELRELRARPEPAELLEQARVLSELRAVFGDPGQIRIVGFAQLGAVHHRVEVAHLAPRAVEALGRVLERRDEIGPGRLVAVGGDARDQSAVVRQQLVDGGRDEFRLELREARQSGKIEQRIHVNGPEGGGR